MNERKNNFCRMAAAALTIFVAAASLCAQTTAPTTPVSTPGVDLNVVPEGFEGATITPHLNAQLPLDATFKDEQGNTVKLGDYFNKSHKPVLLSIVYYECPMLCNLTLNGVVDVVKPINLQIGNDFEIVTISFNHKELPQLAAAKKKNYLKLLGKPEAAAGWHFLTGQESDILKVTQAVGFGFKWNPANQEYLHQSGIFICTPDGKISRTMGGVSFDRNELKDSLVMASDGKIGSPIFQVFLSCGIYHYDDNSGRYVRTKWLPAIGGGAILLAVGGLLGTLWYRDSRRHPPVPEGEKTNSDDETRKDQPQG